MPGPIYGENGLVERVRAHGEQINKLWDEKSSKESVENLEQDVKELKKEVRDEVGGLRKVLIGVAGAWLFGTVMFLIAALEFAR